MKSIKAFLRGQPYKILVDDKDFVWLSSFTWCIRKSQGTVYASTSIEGKTVPIHRLIMKAKRGQLVHHINENGLDNRRKNFKVTTNSEHVRKHMLQYWDKIGRPKNHIYKYSRKWVVHKYVKGKILVVGRFDTEAEAIKAERGSYVQE